MWRQAHTIYVNTRNESHCRGWKFSKGIFQLAVGRGNHPISRSGSVMPGIQIFPEEWVAIANQFTTKFRPKIGFKTWILNSQPHLRPCQENHISYLSFSLYIYIYLFICPDTYKQDSVQIYPYIPFNPVISHQFFLNKSAACCSYLNTFTLIT